MLQGGCVCGGAPRPLDIRRSRIVKMKEELSGADILVQRYYLLYARMEYNKHSQ